MIRSACLALTLMLTACASAPPETSYYLLRSGADQQSRELSPSSRYTLGTVAIAPYIDHPGLVLQTRSGEMRPAQYHQWAEPLFDGVHIFLLKEISVAAGIDLAVEPLQPDATVVDVRIDQMHGTHDGNARLVAYWWLRKEKQLLAAHQFADERQLEGDGYAQLARAEAALLSRLAKAIADSLEVDTSGSSGDQ